MNHFDLENQTRQVSTPSTRVQRWFDIGLNRGYGFDHEEGVKCFERALELDPQYTANANPPGDDSCRAQ